MAHGRTIAWVTLRSGAKTSKMNAAVTLLESTRTRHPSEGTLSSSYITHSELGGVYRSSLYLPKVWVGGTAMTRPGLELRTLTLWSGSVGYTRVGILECLVGGAHCPGSPIRILELCPTLGAIGMITVSSTDSRPLYYSLELQPTAAVWQVVGGDHFSWNW